MRILGIDHGTKRIGLAIADEDGTLAVPFGVLEHTGMPMVLAEVRRLIAQEEISRIVIGIPLSLDGDQQSDQEVLVRAFIDALRGAIDVPIETIDERFTTTEAAMIAGAVPRKQRVQKDEAAAAIILQAYLDQRMSKSGARVNQVVTSA